MAITQKVRMAEFWFMFTRLFHNVFYQCMKFQVNSFYGLEVMTWTKIQTENYQRAITKKIRVAELWFLCIALLHNGEVQCT